MMMTDAYDETENCLHIAIEMDGEIHAAVRLHLASRLSSISPTLEVFPEILESLEQGKTVLDPTRFVVDPTSRKQRVPLHFLALRIPFLATMYYDVDLALAPVRTEHTAFYRRYLGYSPALTPRSYPGLAKPIQLLIANVREQRDTVLARTPVFGPVEGIPNSDIAFPPLTRAYMPSNKTRSAAA
jgi:N-acyl-L-homoserine lactone synthetase